MRRIVPLIDRDRYLAGVQFWPTYMAALDATGGQGNDAFDGWTLNAATNPGSDVRAAPELPLDRRSSPETPGKAWGALLCRCFVPVRWTILVAGCKTVMTGQDFNSFLTHAAATQNSGSDWICFATTAGWQDDKKNTAPPACPFTRSDRTPARRCVSDDRPVGDGVHAVREDRRRQHEPGASGADNNQRFPDSWPAAA